MDHLNNGNGQLVPTSKKLGTLSNDDGNAKDNAWKKTNLYFTVEFRRCLDLFSTSLRYNASIRFQMNIRKEMVHVVLNTQNLVISRCFLKRTAKKCTELKRTCTATVLLIKPFVWWCSRCRRRHCLLKLPFYSERVRFISALGANYF